MKKISVLYILLIFLFGACQPKHILSSKKMENILYDLHKAEAIIEVENLAVKQDSSINKFYEVLLEKHGISQAQFDSSIVWYTNNPQRFNKIYPRVIKRLEADLEKLRKQDIEPEKMKLRPVEDEKMIRRGICTMVDGGNALFQILCR